MKKLFPVILATFIAAAGYGQDFGIKGGLNYSNLVPDNSDLEYGEYIFGFHLGGFGAFELTEKLSLRPEVLYSKKGFDLELPTASSAIKIQRRFHYLSLPLLMEFKPLQRLSLLAGPEFGYLIAARQDVNLPAFSEDIDGMYRKFDFGLSVGINLQIIEKIQSEIRYTHGFSDLNNESGFAGSGLQNRTFQLSVGYQIN